MLYLKFVTKRLPANNDWAVAIAAGPVIFMKPSAAKSKSTLEHEKVHVGYFWKWAVVMVSIALMINYYANPFDIPFFYMATVAITIRSLVYGFYAPYRVWEEIQAYKREIEIDKLDEQGIVRIAKSLQRNYGAKQGVDKLVKRLKSEG
jgi:hypothetical protein